MKERVKKVLKKFLISDGYSIGKLIIKFNIIKWLTIIFIKLVLKAEDMSTFPSLMDSARFTAQYKE